MQVAEYGHGLHGGVAGVSIEAGVIVGDTKLCVGVNQSFIQHLFLFVGHVGDQQGEEGEHLLDLPCQHGVDVRIVQLVDQFHLRCEGGTDLHDIDTVAGAGGEFDVGSAHLMTGAFELMAFERCNDEALGSAHSQSQGHGLNGDGLAAAGGTADHEVGVLIAFGIEWVNDAQGVVVPVQAQQNAVVVGQLEAGEHIGGCGAAGEHIALCLALKVGGELQKRHGGAQSLFLLENAVAHLNVHGLEHVCDLLLAPEQFPIAGS